MGHEITATDRFGEVTNGERAWHGMLHKALDAIAAMPDAEQVKEAFKELGLTWLTDKARLFFECPVTGILIHDEESAMHVRLSDKQGVQSTKLGIVGKDYQPVPNKVLAEFSDAIRQVDNRITIETGGSLRGGRRVFVCLKLPQDIVLGNGDRIKRYLIITNCHDGTGAFRAYLSDVRVVCANTYAMAERSAGTAGFWHRHDDDVKAKIEQAKSVLGFIAKAAEKSAENEVSCLPKVPILGLPTPVGVEDLMNHHPPTEPLGFWLATYAQTILGGRPWRNVGWYDTEFMCWTNTDEVLWFAALLETMPRSIFESVCEGEKDHG